MVGLGGLEPPTSPLSVVRSFQENLYIKGFITSVFILVFILSNNLLIFKR
jgi:hypothetical protein